MAQPAGGLSGPAPLASPAVLTAIGFALLRAVPPPQLVALLKPKVDNATLRAVARSLGVAPTRIDQLQHQALNHIAHCITGRIPTLGQVRGVQSSPPSTNDIRLWLNTFSRSDRIALAHAAFLTLEPDAQDQISTRMKSEIEARHRSDFE